MKGLPSWLIALVGSLTAAVWSRIAPGVSTHSKIQKSLKGDRYCHLTSDWQRANAFLELENRMLKALSRFFNDESGVTAIEYGLIASLVAVVIIGAVTLVGTNLSATFQTVAGKV
jgi:pilus assembly protein Flp/PilA